MENFAETIIAYNRSLHFEGVLPDGIKLLNPYQEGTKMDELSALFYRKYYADSRRRHLILGINPGRFGGGMTGIPFTDTKRLIQACGISHDLKAVYEPSSAFIYDMIEAYGGPRDFYADFYFNSVCPLGFISVDEKERETNYNYYDSKALQKTVSEFIVENIRTLLTFPISTEICFCLGTGQNAAFLSKLNADYHFFQRIVPLDHPRYVMQYKTKQKAEYIEKYLKAFNTREY